MRNVLLFAALALLGVGSSSAQTPSTASPPLVVIVNAASKVSTATTAEISDLFLGRSRSLGDIKQAIVLDQPIASPLRARFYRALTGKEIAEINAYWARLLFSGQSSPPLAMPDAATVLDMVRTNPTAIGYLEKAPDDKGVRVVLQLPATR
jgi:ABC-type phosphate transport system substrate-binding protein